jgi:hypothetical protein
MTDSFSGVSCFVGLAVTCLFLPMNHYAGKLVVGSLPSFVLVVFYLVSNIYSCSRKSNEGL